MATKDLTLTLPAELAALNAQESRKLEAVRDKLARSLADPWPSVPADELFDRLEVMLDAIKGK